MVISPNRGLQCRPRIAIVLGIGTPQKDNLILGNSEILRRQALRVPAFNSTQRPVQIHEDATALSLLVLLLMLLLLLFPCVPSCYTHTTSFTTIAAPTLPYPALLFYCWPSSSDYNIVLRCYCCFSIPLLSLKPQLRFQAILQNLRMILVVCREWRN